MYDPTDPRASLAPAAGAGPTFTAYAAPDVGRFYQEAPQSAGDGAESWLIRSQNAVVAYAKARDGARFERADQPDEYVLLLPGHDAAASVDWNGTTTEVPAFSIAFIPPGASKVTIRGAGEVVRIFTTAAEDLCTACGNAEAYAEDHPNVAPVVPWPQPKDGRKVRVYSLDVPPEPGRFGRIWRGETLMVNFLDPQVGPRDITKLSPHHHDDFEQCSLALEGTFIHHLRWTWTPDMRMWREDRHEECASPSVLVIPPPAIHTSRGIDAGVNQLVDIFCPPRVDFSQKPGWVLNADDYPMPGE
ncbi:cupin domain-containing protein [Acidimangrovimonas sediminis]|uniref:hypothetical protein n=1 Tax=Acidimangrovimonas sediminis TaxID=2056283 RepID=UPI000C80207A|nr:hypothetical protein [Acidimangrovimonas sediminis]